MLKLIKRISVLSVFVLLVMGFSFSADARGLGKKGDLAVGGDIMLGGATKPMSGADGGFAFGIEPMVMVFPIDNLAIFTRMPFWERQFSSFSAGGFSVDLDIDYFPFLFGARYYYTIPSLKAMQIYGGGAIGATVGTSGSGLGGTGSSSYFSIDMHFGGQYEVIDNLGIDFNFDIYMPNIGPRSGGEKVVARFGVMGGVFYHFSIF